MTQIQRNDKVKSAASSARTLLFSFLTNKMASASLKLCYESGDAFYERKDSAFLQEFLQPVKALFDGIE